MSPLAKVMAEHFIGMERLLEIVRLTKVMKDPVDIIAELESEDVHRDKKDPKAAGSKPGASLKEPEKGSGQKQKKKRKR